MNKMRLYDICKNFLVLFNKVSPFCKCRLKLPSCHILIIIEIDAFFFFNQLSSFPINSLSLTKVVSVFSLFSLLVDQA